MYIKVFALLLFFSLPSFAQDTLKIDERGEELKNFYLNLNVENLWQSGHHINWETGQPDMPNAKQGIKTHCSAFIAGACKKMNIYILRPPEHGQVLLANAQYTWLAGTVGYDSGWTNITMDDSIFIKAQKYANNGYVVVAVRKNPNKRKPGHIAFVMPYLTTTDDLSENGPQLIMASSKNYNSIPFRKGFSHSQWPDNSILFYYYKKPYSLKNDN